MILRTSTSHEEGCRREWSILTKEFRGDANGHVESLVTVRIEWTKDDQGRHVFKEVAGTQEVWPCQLVLLAMGFVGPEKRGPIADLNLEMDPRGNVKGDAQLHDQRAKACSPPATCAAANRWWCGPFTKGAKPPAPSTNT